MIAFFDASALICLIEAVEPLAGRVRAELARLARQHRNVDAAVSRLTRLDSRVKPAGDADLAALAAFDAFFARPDLIGVELTRDLVELATAIRVRHGLRTPAALRAASCLQLATSTSFSPAMPPFPRSKA